MFLLQTNLYIVRFKTDIPVRVTTQYYKYLSPATTYQVCCLSALRYQATGKEDFLCYKLRQSQRELLCIVAIVAILIEYCR